MINKTKILETLKNIPDNYYYGKIPKANLHIHSEYSDGCLEVGEICTKALNEGKKYIAISDHNTLAQVRELDTYRDYFLKKGLNSIDAVELSTKDGKSEIHLLIYGAKYEDRTLQNMCKNAHFYNNVNTKKAVKELSQRYVVVLAHPLVYSKLFLANFIKKLKKNGLDGLELHYPYEDLNKLLELSPFPEKKFFPKLALFRKKLVNLEKIAKKYDLLTTGGKDAHGLELNDSLKYNSRT